MHYLIKLLVKADNKDEALREAENVADDLVERQEFDWYDFNGRWGKSKAVKLSSKAGQQLVADALKNNREDFDRAIKAVRSMVDKYTDDQIFNEEFEKEEYYASRYQFGIVYQHGGGNHNYLYSYECEPLNTQKELSYYTDKDLWVVTVDFHN